MRSFEVCRSARFPDETSAARSTTTELAQRPLSPSMGLGDARCRARAVSGGQRRHLRDRPRDAGRRAARHRAAGRSALDRPSLRGRRSSGRVGTSPGTRSSPGSRRGLPRADAAGSSAALDRFLTPGRRARTSCDAAARGAAQRPRPTRSAGRRGSAESTQVPQRRRRADPEPREPRVRREGHVRVAARRARRGSSCSSSPAGRATPVGRRAVRAKRSRDPGGRERRSRCGARRSWRTTMPPSWESRAVTAQAAAGIRPDAGALDNGHVEVLLHPTRAPPEDAGTRSAGPRGKHGHEVLEGDLRLRSSAAVLLREARARRARRARHRAGCGFCYDALVAGGATILRLAARRARLPRLRSRTALPTRGPARAGRPAMTLDHGRSGLLR